MIILLNGPPRSGKDTIADMMSEYNGYSKLRFKDRLIKITSAIYDVHENLIEELLDDTEGKEEPSKMFGGLSLRQALIHVSEDVVKPNFGNDYFGKITARYVDPSSKACISDTGFIDEAMAIVEKAGVENILLVHLYRKGCNFSNDSRSYLDADKFKHFLILENNGSKNDALNKVEVAIKLAEWRNENCN